MISSGLHYLLTFCLLLFSICHCVYATHGAWKFPRYGSPAFSYFHNLTYCGFVWSKQNATVRQEMQNVKVCACVCMENFACIAPVALTLSVSCLHYLSPNVSFTYAQRYSAHTNQRFPYTTHKCTYIWIHFLLPLFLILMNCKYLQAFYARFI